MQMDLVKRNRFEMGWMSCRLLQPFTRKQLKLLV